MLVYIDIFMKSLLKQISSLIIHFSPHTENQIFLWSIHSSCLSPVLNDLATVSAESDSHAAYSHLTRSSIAGDLIVPEALCFFGQDKNVMKILNELNLHETSMTTYYTCAIILYALMF